MLVGRRGIGFVLSVAVLVACSGKGATGDGGPGAAGGGGSGNAAGGGAGGSGGATAGTAGAGGSSGQPACAIAARPDDPVNPDGGVATGCNTLAFGADWVSTEFVDAGTTEEPAAGAMIDGDYDLVRHRIIGISQSRTRRSLRIFDGGSYIEWLVNNEVSNGDASVMNGDASFDTRQQPSGTAPFSLTFTCGSPELLTPDYTFAYTASGDELLIFTYYTGRLVSVYTYRRSCSR